MGGSKPRPSDARRAKLKQSEVNKIPNISNLTPIQRYYDLSQKLIQLFDAAVDKNQLDEAYIYGVRFAQFCTKVLPKHDYYKVKQREYIQLRKNNQDDLKRVIDALEQVVNLMDLDELEKERTRKREEDALRLIREREEQMRKEEEERSATQALLDRLNMLDNLSVPSGVQEKPPKSMEDELAELEEEEVGIDLPIGIGGLPIPIPYDPNNPNANVAQPPPPPAYASINQEKSLPPPPAYNALMQQQQQSFSDYRMDSVRDLRPSSSRSLQTMPSQDYDPERTTFINPLGPAGPLVPASLLDHGQVKNKPPPLPFSSQKAVARSRYYAARGKNMIEVFHLGTYQGRNTYKDSTNGCTVISPLVAVNHLNSEGGISDFVIEQVIDEIAPDVLSKVRRKLGLAGHALIIPSDVHDYMVDEKILKQEMFVGVCGGNVLDVDHVNEMLNLLENGVDQQPNDDDRDEKKDSSKKVAAAFFFHEHVVSVLKVVLPDGSMWYDLVDSMPTRITKNGQSLLGATRTRCKDRESLQVLLSMYACEKFSQADAQYIDNNEWDDAMCDFDPRVFQGFVWKE